MIELFGANTPNVCKVACTLEELGLKYKVKKLDLKKGEQLSTEFTKLNPIGKVPCILDHEMEDFILAESCAIMLYLSNKCDGKLTPSNSFKHSKMLESLFANTSNFGKIYLVASELAEKGAGSDAAKYVASHQGRVLTSLESLLGDQEYLCGDFSLADIANWCCLRDGSPLRADLTNYPKLKSWESRVSRRPAMQRGVASVE